MCELTCCDYCKRQMKPARVSDDGDATEYRCRPCGYSHTLKRSEPDSAFAFFPDDIKRDDGRRGAAVPTGRDAMSDLDGLLAGIVADPLEQTR